jgi:hypothetical protein
MNKCDAKKCLLDTADGEYCPLEYNTSQIGHLCNCECSNGDYPKLIIKTSSSGILFVDETEYVEFYTLYAASVCEATSNEGRQYIILCGDNYYSFQHINQWDSREEAEYKLRRDFRYGAAFGDMAETLLRLIK